jgi:hypothetical protein
MSTSALHEFNQRYVRLTDRCRSQWTFYQFLQGLFKHLLDSECPIDLDFPGLLGELKDLSNIISHPDIQRTEKTIAQLAEKLDQQSQKLLEIDAGVPTSLLRRFFDRLRTQDEKILLAIIKFYLDGHDSSEDTLDKLHLLFTRLAEIQRESGGSVMRERHEIERLVQPLLMHRPPSSGNQEEVEILLRAIGDLRAEVLASRRFSELVAGGALDRFRILRRRLGDNLLHPRLLPPLLETTVIIKNRFRELWQEEESQLLADTNRVRDMQRHLSAHPEMMTPELREALELFDSAHSRYAVGKQEDNIRREDMVEFRVRLNNILEQFDGDQSRPTEDIEAEDVVEEVAAQPGENTGISYVPPATSIPPEVALPNDSLLQESLSKIIFALELVGRDTPAAQAAQAKELRALRVEVWEIEACQRVLAGELQNGSLEGERARHLLQAAASDGSLTTPFTAVTPSSSSGCIARVSVSCARTPGSG